MLLCLLPMEHMTMVDVGAKGALFAGGWMLWAALTQRYKICPATCGYVVLLELFSLLGGHDKCAA